VTSKGFLVVESRDRRQTRVQLAQGDGLMFQVNRWNYCCYRTTGGSNPVATSDAGKALCRARIGW
jgi:hypothetical protein